jgi:hypothetical protein
MKYPTSSSQYLIAFIFVIDNLTRFLPMFSPVLVICLAGF